MAEAAEGWSAEEVFTSHSPQGYGWDDLVFLPGHERVEGTPVSLASKLTRNMPLNLPVVGGPVDTVTEAEMAIALAQMGGIGIIHREQSIESQAAMVLRVKKYQTGFILHCHTLKPISTVQEARAMQAEFGISCIPITDNGRMGGRITGIVTARDLEAADSGKAQLRTIMTKDPIVVHEPVSIMKARETMAVTKVSKLPVVNVDNELVALLVRGDFKKELENPLATVDSNRTLCVAASICPSDEDAWERIQAVVDAGVDLFCLDTDEGVFPDTVHFVKRVKDQYEGIDVLAGRIKSCRQAKDLCDAGVDGISVGFSGNSGTASASMLWEIARFVKTDYPGVPVIADFGTEINNNGRLLKAFCLGASAVAFDGFLENTEEAPGDHIYRDGIRVKLRHSKATGGAQLAGLAMASAVVSKGNARGIVQHALDSVKRGMQDLCIKDLLEVHHMLNDSSELRMERMMHREDVERPRLHRVSVSGLHNRW